MRQHCGGLIVMNAVIAGEGVVDAGIAMHRHMAVHREALFDPRLGVLIDVFVFLGDMRHPGCCDAVGFVEPLIDTDAVIADIALRVGPARHQIGQQAAKTEPDRPRLAGAGVEAAQMVQRDLQVIDALFHVESLVELERLLPFGIGLVGDLNAGFLAPEKIRTDRDIALRRESIAMRPHVGIDAEDFLNGNDSGTRTAFGNREIGGKFTVAAWYRDVGHVLLP